MHGEIEINQLFILSGQKAYVAEKGETFTTSKGRTDARLRVIFDNGTESNLLMRSLERALQKDETGPQDHRSNGRATVFPIRMQMVMRPVERSMCFAAIQIIL